MPRALLSPTSLLLQRWRLAAFLLMLALLPLIGLYAALSPASLPEVPASPEGFRQLGQTLIGEVRTPDGRRLTLVLDARTREVIGSRLEDRADPQTRP